MWRILSVASAQRFGWLCLLVATMALLGGCGHRAEESHAEGVATSYAEGFYFDRGANGELELVVRNADALAGEPSRVVYRFGGLQDLSDSLVVLSRVPKRVVCLSTTHVGFLDALACAGDVVGVSGTDYVSCRQVSDSIAAGRVRDVGPVETLNYELLLTLHPDLVLAYDVAGTSATMLHRLNEMGIPVLLVGEYKERSPLGRAEWLRAVGFLMGRTAMADSAFAQIAARYSRQRDRVKTAWHRPKVLINAPWQDTWYIPGADSYMARLIADAGGKLLTAGHQDADSHSVSFEVALGLGMQAEYWLHPGCETLHALRSMHPAFGGFPSVEVRQVYGNTRRVNAKGGNDFWESGVVHPDLLLRDLVRILHPDQGARADSLHYYRRLL